MNNKSQDPKQDDIPESLRIAADVKGLEIVDLNIPRLIVVWAINSQGTLIKRHLIINENGKIALV